MSIEPEDDESIELVEAEQIVLMDDSCWIYDPDALHPESGVPGVLAVLLRGGQLWVLDGASREWLSVEAKPGKKPEKFRTVS